MNEEKKFYVTTPIYYPSGRFHIGTAYTTVLANTMKKYKEQRGYDSFMLTGSKDVEENYSIYKNILVIFKLLLLQWILILWYQWSLPLQE